MSKLKITGIVSMIVLLIACLGINAWYLSIRLSGVRKVASHTYEIGLQQTTDGDTKYFMEVNTYDNLFEIKFNYMLDENQEAFYSQGIQYCLRDGVSNLSWLYSEDNESKVEYDSDGILWWKTRYYNAYTCLSFDITSCGRFNYMSGDDWKTVTKSSNPISESTRFKIQLGDKLYLMEFKGENSGMTDMNKAYTYYHGDEVVHYYYYYDVEYLAYKLWESIHTLPNGTNQACVFEFGDMFNYYEQTGENEYSVNPVKDSDLVIRDIKSYYSIKVTKHEGRAEKSSDSILNCLWNSQTYNTSGIESEDYFYGRTLITANNNAFIYVKVTETHVALKLKEEFRDIYLPYTDKIYLKVLIDVDQIIADGLEFVGFTNDSGLENYVISSCEKVQTIDGELVYSEVAYVC